MENDTLSYRFFTRESDAQSGTLALVGKIVVTECRNILGLLACYRTLIWQYG